MAKIKIDFLLWDSNFFGLKIGKIDFSSNKESQHFDELGKFIRNSDYDLIYLFTNLGQIPFKLYQDWSGFTPILW